MNTAFPYCHLVRLDSSGGFQVRAPRHLHIWFQQQCLDLLMNASAADLNIQTRLLSLWRANGAESQMAQLSLRCFVSHQILRVCTQLANQFGDFYSFTRDDLLPLVLDDTGEAGQPYQPFTLEILHSYDAAKARLSTWAAQLTRHHAELNRYLLGKGLYRASDWAILNDTTPEQLCRVLAEYHGWPEADIAAAHDLLVRYHQVYRQARLSQRLQGQRLGRCQQPTLEQLRQILPQLPPAESLARLRGLAAQLRQYRIHVRSGHPMTFLAADLGQDFSLENLPDPTHVNVVEGDDDQVEFLQSYRRCLRQALTQALRQSLEARLASLQKRRPDQAMVYLYGLWLFYGEGLAMGAIAPHVGLKNQVQVTRLLQLGQLRQAVRQHLLEQLPQRVQAQVQRYASPERLAQVGVALEYLLIEEIDSILAAAAAEAQISKGRCAKSLFAHTLCQVLRPWVAPCPLPALATHPETFHPDRYAYSEI